jgi:hypothetical protein
LLQIIQITESKYCRACVKTKTSLLSTTYTYFP